MARLGFVVGGVVMFFATGSLAVSLGPSRGAAYLGQPLDVAVPAVIPSQARGAALADLCVNVDVAYGEKTLAPSRVQVSIDDMQAPGANDVLVIRVRAPEAIDEPFVALDVRIGCEEKLQRQYVVLADLPPEVELHSDRAILNTVIAAGSPLLPSGGTPFIAPAGDALPSAQMQVVEAKTPSTSRAATSASDADPLTAPQRRVSAAEPLVPSTPDSPAPVAISGASAVTAPDVQTVVPSGPPLAAAELEPSQGRRPTAWIGLLLLAATALTALAAGALAAIKARRSKRTLRNAPASIWSAFDDGFAATVLAERANAAHQARDPHAPGPRVGKVPTPEQAKERAAPAAQASLGEREGQTWYMHDDLLMAVAPAPELSDAKEKAEFFVALGRPEQAAQALRSSTPPDLGNPIGYLELFELYYQLKLRDEYEALRQTFRTRFNAQVLHYEAYDSQAMARKIAWVSKPPANGGGAENAGGVELPVFSVLDHAPQVPRELLPPSSPARPHA